MTTGVVGYSLLTACCALLVSVPATAQLGPPSDPIPDITDCALAYGRNKYFCESKTWRAAEAEVHRLLLEAQQAGPMWVTPRADYEFWKRKHRAPNASLINIHSDYGELAEALQRLTAATKEFQSRTAAREELETRCMVAPGLTFPTFMLSCRVASLSGVAPGLIVQSQEWDLQSDSKSAGSMVHILQSFSIVIFEREDGESDTGEVASKPVWHPVAWMSAAGATIAPPVLSVGPHGTFITTPITSEGSGANSQDIVIRRVEPLKWREVDAQTWRRDLEKRVPRPLIPKMSASLDIANMSSQVTLARPDDPNAGPTGGNADVRLVVRDDVLVIDGITLSPASKPSQATAPVRGAAPVRRGP